MSNGEGPKLKQSELKDSDYPAPRAQFKKNGHTYVVCDKGKCWLDFHEKSSQISCWTEWSGLESSSSCRGRCECMLLRASTWDAKPNWEPVPDADKQGKDEHGRDLYPYQPKSYVYWCACVVA